MGFDKAVTPLALRSPSARVAEGLGQRTAVIVVPPHLSENAALIAPAARIVVNWGQAHGMSLRRGQR
jgi:hypothetical protein